jgi:hypothetical protein
MLVALNRLDRPYRLSTLSLVDVSRASPLSPFEQPLKRVSQQGAGQFEVSCLEAFMCCKRKSEPLDLETRNCTGGTCELLSPESVAL